MTAFLIGFIRGLVGANYSRAASVGTFGEVVFGSGSYFFIDYLVVTKFIMGNNPDIYLAFVLGAFLGGIGAWILNNKK